MISASQLAQLWTQHAAGLRLLARVRSDLADDCVQEAFVRLSQQPALPNDPLAWLVRVVRNCALVEIRSEKRRKAREEHWQQKSDPWLASHSPIFTTKSNCYENGHIRSRPARIFKNLECVIVSSFPYSTLGEWRATGRNFDKNEEYKHLFFQ